MESEQQQGCIRMCQLALGHAGGGVHVCRWMKACRARRAGQVPGRCLRLVLEAAASSGAKKGLSASKQPSTRDGRPQPPRDACEWPQRAQCMASFTQRAAGAACGKCGR